MKKIYVLIFLLSNILMNAQNGGFSDISGIQYVDENNYDDFIISPNNLNEFMLNGWTVYGITHVKVYVNNNLEGTAYPFPNTNWEEDAYIQEGLNELYLDLTCNQNCSPHYSTTTPISFTYVKAFEQGDFYATILSNNNDIEINWENQYNPRNTTFYYQVIRDISPNISNSAFYSNWSSNKYFIDNYPKTPGQTYYYWVNVAINNNGLHRSGIILNNYVSKTIPVNLNVSTNNITFDHNGGNENVSISCNSSWTASTSESWINISTPSGNLNGSISINVSNSNINRQGIVTISSSNVSRTINVTQTGNLGVPPHLTSNAISHNEIELNWSDNYDNELNFEVERSSNPSNNFQLIETLNSNITSYIDNNGLNSNTTYYYRVRAVNNIGASDYSNITYATTLSSPVIFKSLDFYTQPTPNPTNPNNYINQGLPIRFKVKVKNELAQNLSALTGTITCSTPGVTISDNTVNFSTILSGNETWSSDEFEITVDPSVANGTNLEFELSCNDPLVGGGPWTSSFSFPIAPLQTGNIVLIDNQGDNDGIPEPGESNIILQPKIDNVSTSTMASVRGILSSDDSFLNITQNDNMYNVSNNVPEPINTGDTDIAPGLPFKFDYPSTEALQELNFNLELQAHLNDNNGTLLKWQDTFSFNDGIEPPPSIVSTVPQDDAVDVAIDTDLEIHFSKNVTAVSGKNIYLYKDNNLELTLPVTDSQVSVSNDVVNINLSNDLEGGSDYFVIIDQGAFQDSQGQDFGGISQSNEWNFTTVQSDPPVAPVLTATVLSDTEVSLSWNSVADADTYKVSSCDGTTVYANSLTSTDFTVDNLTAQTSYDFVVQAENTAGLSPASNCEQVTTLCGLPWGSPVIYPNFTRAFCVVTIDGQPATEQDKVAAFVGTELRGIGDVFLSNGTAYSVVNIQGSVVETASFKVWDSSECNELDVSYTTDTNPTGTIGAAPNFLPIAASTSSVSENILSGIEIYPNPTHSILNIEKPDNIKINKIEIFDILGKKVFIDKKNYKQISLKTLKTGIYFINIQSDRGIIVFKIIKN